jgi:hypothetical protein
VRSLPRPCDLEHEVGEALGRIRDADRFRRRHRPSLAGWLSASLRIAAGRSAVNSFAARRLRRRRWPAPLRPFRRRALAASCRIEYERSASPKKGSIM